MSKYQIEMKVINSGSPNDYPCSGASSECYLSVGSISPDSQDVANVTTLFAKDICNGHTYSSFLDAKSKKAVSVIEIDDTASSALILSFSVYWGSRSFDKVLGLVAEKALGVAFGNIYAEIAAGMVGDLLKEKLKVFEKKLVSKIKNDVDSFVDTIGVETIDSFDLFLANNKVTLKIRSDVDRQETFLDSPVITAGDLVAEITFTKVA
ncbi:MAG: hypothetical protein WC091_03305 [Sulfuricellaceae bacterium]